MGSRRIPKRAQNYIVDNDSNYINISSSAKQIRQQLAKTLDGFSLKNPFETLVNLVSQGKIQYHDGQQLKPVHESDDSGLKIDSDDPNILKDASKFYLIFLSFTKPDFFRSLEEKVRKNNISISEAFPETSDDPLIEKVRIFITNVRDQYSEEKRSEFDNFIKNAVITDNAFKNIVSLIRNQTDADLATMKNEITKIGQRAFYVRDIAPDEPAQQLRNMRQNLNSLHKQALERIQEAQKSEHDYSKDETSFWQDRRFQMDEAYAKALASIETMTQVVANELNLPDLKPIMTRAEVAKTLSQQQALKQPISDLPNTAPEIKAMLSDIDEMIRTVQNYSKAEENEINAEIEGLRQGIAQQTKYVQDLDQVARPMGPPPIAGMTTQQPPRTNEVLRESQNAARSKIDQWSGQMNELQKAERDMTNDRALLDQLRTFRKTIIERLTGVEGQWEGVSKIDLKQNLSIADMNEVNLYYQRIKDLFQEWKQNNVRFKRLELNTQMPDAPTDVRAGYLGHLNRTKVSAREPYEMKLREARLQKRARNLRKLQARLAHRGCLNPWQQVGARLAPEFQDGVFDKFEAEIENAWDSMDIMSDNMIRGLKRQFAMLTEMLRMTEASNKNQNDKFNLKLQDLFIKNIHDICDYTRRHARNFRQLHTSFFIKYVAPYRKYIERWKGHHELRRQISLFEPEIDRLENKLSDFMQTSQSFLMQSYLPQFAELTDRVNVTRYVFQPSERSEVNNAIEETKTKIIHTAEVLDTSLSWRDYIMDRQFLTVYVLKLVNLGLWVVASQVLRSLFVDRYIKRVYREGQKPPSLIKLVLWASGSYGLTSIAIILVVNNLVRYGVRGITFDEMLMRMFAKDAALTTIIVMAITAVTAAYFQKPDLFCFTTEGLRALNITWVFMSIITVILTVIPTFLIHL